MTSKQITVEGVAIKSGVSRNGILYTKEELGKTFKELANKPLLKDHNATVDNTIGRTTHASFDDKTESVMFKGWIKDESVIEKIQDGRINEVSIGAVVDEVVKESEDAPYEMANGVHYLELSVTPTPGVVGTSIATVTAPRLGEHVMIVENVNTIHQFKKETRAEDSSVDSQTHANANRAPDKTVDGSGKLPGETIAHTTDDERTTSLIKCVFCDWFAEGAGYVDKFEGHIKAEHGFTDMQADSVIRLYGLSQNKTENEYTNTEKTLDSGKLASFTKSTGRGEQETEPDYKAKGAETHLQSAVSTINETNAEQISKAYAAYARKKMEDTMSNEQKQKADVGDDKKAVAAEADMMPEDEEEDEDEMKKKAELDAKKKKEEEDYSGYGVKPSPEGQKFPGRNSGQSVTDYQKEFIKLQGEHKQILEMNKQRLTKEYMKLAEELGVKSKDTAAYSVGELQALVDNLGEIRQVKSEQPARTRGVVANATASENNWDGYMIEENAPNRFSIWKMPDNASRGDPRYMKQKAFSAQVGA